MRRAIQHNNINQENEVDDRDYLSFLPPELWLTIFSFLGSLENLLPLYTVCVSWSKKLIDECVLTIGERIMKSLEIDNHITRFINLENLSLKGTTHDSINGGWLCRKGFISNRNLSMLKRLKTLICRPYGFWIRDEGIKDLVNLTSLDIYMTYEVSDLCIRKLTNLSSIIISSNISNEGIRDLTNLVSLDVRHNCQISDDGLKGLTNLTSLSLLDSHRYDTYNDNENYISNESITRLTNLVSLDLRDDFHKIDIEGIRKLSKLRDLYLYENQQKIQQKDLIELPLLTLHYTSYY
jgi:hypothetical protein